MQVNRKEIYNDFERYNSHVFSISFMGATYRTNTIQDQYMIKYL